jgi:hypothetical protein
VGLTKSWFFPLPLPPLIEFTRLFELFFFFIENIWPTLEKVEMAAPPMDFLGEWASVFLFPVTFTG